MKRPTETPSETPAEYKQRRDEMERKHSYHARMKKKEVRWAGWKRSSLRAVPGGLPGLGKRLTIETLAQIKAPHFCAGIVLRNDRVVVAAHIVRYMGSWTRDQVREYCANNGWTVSVVSEGTV